MPLGLVGCGDDDTDEATRPPTQPPAAEAPAADTPANGGSNQEDEAVEPKPTEETDEAEGPTRSPDERAAARAVRAYVRALAGRDGQAVCELLAPGAIGAVTLPKDRGDCAASLEASIGYRDPRGLPVWKTARVAELRSVDVSGDSAKVVVTTVTEFADRDEPSLEDDVVYLARSDGEWLIAKPSSTLYRAVGVADVPPSVLAAP
ncbi:MAG TPA: hypothetical protein VHJ54_07940 [Solirubrobacterales bacterium]|jgi:hypothetical protein|nr:hypothetical protein [Solirubrobacterales bacterium]